MSPISKSTVKLWKEATIGDSEDVEPAMYRRIPIRLALHITTGSRLNYQSISLLVPYRLQSSSSKTSTTNNIKIDDPKLREIIESTNFGTEAIAEKKRQSEKERQKQMEEEAKEQDDIKSSNHKDSVVIETKSNSDNPSDQSENNVVPNNSQFQSSILTQAMNNAQLNDENNENNIVKSINESIHREIQNLPSDKEGRRSHLSKQLEKYLDSIQETIFTATKALNDVTGYSSIDKLKRSIDNLEAELKEARDDVKSKKVAYTEAIQRRSTSQREVNELLTRKHNWSSNDLERFTELYRNDHVNEQFESETESKLNEAEKKVDSIQLKLTQSILTRYHEEQIWSDKIRRASTWGTWILMGINLLLFIIATFFVEPWKRKRLVAAFEAKVIQLLEAVPEKDQEVLVPIVENIKADISDKVDQEVINIEDDIKHEKEVLQSRNTSLIFLGNTWTSIIHRIKQNYETFISPQIQTLSVNKLEFELFSTVAILLGCGIGSLVTLYFK